MKNPALYAKNNGLQRHTVNILLDEYIHLIRWKNNGGDQIMDIGCGTGDVTVQILLSKLPSSIGQLVATDLSMDMIQYARSQHPHVQVKYDVLDIVAKKLPEPYYERFHHVFSFYCLHWIHDQRQAMANILHLLKPGGDILLIYSGNVPLLEFLLKLAQQDFWKPFMPDARKYLPYHHHVQDVEGSVRAVLQDVGFEKIICHCRRMVYEFENFQKYIDAILALIPIIEALPEHSKEKYLTEFANEMKNIADSEEWTSDGTKLIIPYSMIIVHARKPL